MEQMAETPEEKANREFEEDVDEGYRTVARRVATERAAGTITVYVTVKLSKQDLRNLNAKINKPGIATPDEATGWAEMVLNTELEELRDEFQPKDFSAYDQNSINGGPVK